MSSPWFWVALYFANMLALAGVFRLADAGWPVPLVVFVFVAAACGACQTGLERALELRRKSGGRS